MKKTIPFLFVLALLFVSCTENPAVNKAFVKYGPKKGITAITVPGFVIRLAASFGDLKDEERELLRSIDKVKVLAVDDKTLNQDIDLHKEFYANINKNHDFDELLTVNDKNSSLTVFGKMNDNHIIKEMIVLAGGNDNALVYVKGSIDPELINKLNLSAHGKLLSFSH
jgi:hypothetical protein